MKHILLLGLSLIFVGCANFGEIEDPLATYHESQPRSILIVPILNNSVEVLAGDLAVTTLPKLLSDQGYYVFPVHTVKALFQSEGLYEPAEIHQQPSEVIAELFSADSILYITIHTWTAQYIVLNTTTTIDLEYRMTNAQGEQIFHKRQKLSYSPESSTNEEASLIESLLFSAISAAFERADPEFIPLTRRANERAFLFSKPALPPGPYSIEYNRYYDIDEEAFLIIEE